MQDYCSELVEQSQGMHNNMNVSGRKTKEMMIGPILKEPICTVTTPSRWYYS